MPFWTQFVCIFCRLLAKMCDLWTASGSTGAQNGAPNRPSGPKSGWQSLTIPILDRPKHNRIEKTAKSQAQARSQHDLSTNPPRFCILPIVISSSFLFGSSSLAHWHATSLCQRHARRTHCDATFKRYFAHSLGMVAPRRTSLVGRRGREAL